MRTFFKPLLVITMCAFPLMVTAQVTIGSGSAPASYSLLELDTRNMSGGLRLPQLQGTAIDDFKVLVIDANISDTEGLMFYNLDTHCVEFWNGSIWQPLCGDSIVLGIMRDSISSLQQQIDTLKTQVQYLQNFTELSGIINYTVVTPALLGLGVSVISSGFTYSFGGTGAVTGNLSLTNGGTYYLIRGGTPDNPTAGICEPLTWYQGQATIGTLWIKVGGNAYSLPLYFDATGIYIVPTSQMNLGSGATFRFSQSLILNETHTY